ESRVAKNNLVVRQAAWLAAGSVVRGIVDYKNIRPLVREDKRELKEKFPLDKKMHLIKTITEQIQEVENNMPETSHFLARLVRIFRTTSTSQLKEIHETLYVKADKKIQSLMEHALAIAGTKNTIQ
ncbi:hypothetical protein EXU34_23795, partial [Alteromonas sp. ZYF713]|nr:hypothetical protein [Alteromonas sp. ZYF713]